MRLPPPLLSAPDIAEQVCLHIAPLCAFDPLLFNAQCKHQLAAQLADALQTCAVIGVSDVQMTQMLLVP